MGGISDLQAQFCRSGEVKSSISVDAKDNGKKLEIPNNLQYCREMGSNQFCSKMGKITLYVDGNE